MGKRRASRRHTKGLGEMDLDFGLDGGGVMAGLGALGADAQAVVSESLKGGMDLAIMAGGAVVGLSASELVLSKLPPMLTNAWWKQSAMQAIFAMACGFAAPRVPQQELRGLVVGVGAGAMVSAVLRAWGNLLPNALASYVPRISIGAGDGIAGFGDSFSTRPMLNGVAVDGNLQPAQLEGIGAVATDEYASGAMAGLGYALPNMDPQGAATLV